MVEDRRERPAGEAAPAPVRELVDQVREQAESLGAAAVGGIGSGPDGGAGLIDLISGLEMLASAATALQARAVVELDRVRRAEEAAAGVLAGRRGVGVAAEVGLAARVGIARAQRLLTFATTLCTEMPHTMARLAGGDVSGWRATLLVREADCLDPAARAALDEDLCADPRTLAGLGDRAVAGAARRWCAEHDPAAVVARQSQAEADRNVSLRPAPDTMAYLTALLPVSEGVAAYAALLKQADAARAAGDERTRGQVIADALVAAVTGQPVRQAPPVLVNLVMTDTSLFQGGSEPGLLPGFGPVPAASARDMVDRATRGPGAWLRRLYVAPRSGALVAMDAKRREIPRGLAEFIRLRDGGSCRVAWCDAPARHIDHVVGVAEGGHTTSRNLQGHCEAHNYSKTAWGWRSTSVSHEPVERDRDRARRRRRRRPRGRERGRRRGRRGRGGDRGHEVTIVTPSGHRYTSTAPALPHRPPPLPADSGAADSSPAELRPVRSPGEQVVADLLGFAA